MKRFLCFHLPLAIIFFSIAMWALVLLGRNPILFEYCVGSARLHSSSVETRVFVNGIERPEVKVFSLDETNGPEDRQRFLMYANGAEGIYPVLFIDEAARDIGTTNASKAGNYEIYFDRFLFQSHTAYPIIWASDKVKWGEDPRMDVQPNKIIFFEKTLRGDQKIEINFIGNKN